MIAFLTVPLALFLLVLEGAVLLRIIEGSRPYFYRIERLAAGFLIGSALSAFLLFFAVYAGLLPLTTTGFVVGHGVILGALLVVFFGRFFRGKKVSGFRFPAFAKAPAGRQVSDTAIQIFPQGPSANLKSSHRDLRQISNLPRWAVFLGLALLLFALLKIIAASSDLLLAPAYFDDVYANWNMRAKIFYVAKSLLLDLPGDHELFFGGRVPSYPLTIYFAKVWLAMVAGGFSEAAVNSVNLVFFLALLILFFTALLREAGAVFGFSGILLLLSFPLLLVHATAAYSDLAMGATLFLALSLLRAWLPAEEPRRRTLLLLLGVTAAAMSFLKNEALLLYLPPLTLFVFAGSLKRHRSYLRVCADVWPFLAIVASAVFPWVLFKVMHGLTFGNAQQVGGFSLMPHPEVIPAITSDLLYTGSYLLFFPALLLLLALSGWKLLRSTFAVPLLFLGVLFLGECLLYYLTPLALEAVRHTGFGRGMLQLLPSLAFFSILLLRELLRDLPGNGKPDSVSSGHNDGARQRESACAIR